MCVMEPPGLNPRSGTAHVFMCSAPPCSIVLPVAQLRLAKCINRSACRSKIQISKRAALPATSTKPSAPARSVQQTQITTRNREAVAPQIAPAAADGPFKTATVPTAAQAKGGDGQKTDADTVAHLQRKISQMHVTVLELQQQVRYHYLAAPKLCTRLHEALGLTSVHRGPLAESSGRRSQRASQELTCKCTREASSPAAPCHLTPADVSASNPGLICFCQSLCF